MKKQENAILSAGDLTIGYGSRVVAEGITFSLRQGEILALLGPNGCGKSTLLSTLAGRIPALSGDVTLGDDPVSTLSVKERARRMALVTTKRDMKARLTAREVVLLGRYPYMDGFLREREQDTEACDKAMELVGIRELSGSFADCLSDGQLQRVMLARALCQDTPLILLDEPFSFLDLHFRIRLLEMLRKAAKEEGRGLVMALHDLKEASLIADHLLCFTKEGVRLLQDPKKELKEELIRDMYDLPGSEYDLLWKS